MAAKFKGRAKNGMAAQGMGKSVGCADNLTFVEPQYSSLTFSMAKLDDNEAFITEHHGCCYVFCVLCIHVKSIKLPALIKFHSSETYSRSIGP